MLEREEGRIGVAFSQYAPFIGISDPAGPAATAGLQTFDEIVAVNGQGVRTYTEAKNAILAAQGEAVSLVVLRPAAMELPYGQLALVDPVELSFQPERRGEDLYLGLESAAMFVFQVDPNSPAAKAGLQPGDQVLSMDDREYNLFSTMLGHAAQEYESPHSIKVRREHKS